MDAVKEIKRLILRAHAQHDPTKDKRIRSHDERSKDSWSATTLIEIGLRDGSMDLINVAAIAVRKGWRVLGKAAYPFACHRCKTRYPKGTQNVWVTGERGAPLTYECGNCHGGPRLPGL